MYLFRFIKNQNTYKLIWLNEYELVKLALVNCSGQRRKTRFSSTLVIYNNYNFFFF